MSRTLHMVTVAEGVETSEQAAWLEEQACGRGQGYLWSRPVPLEMARALVGVAGARPDRVVTAS